MYPGIGRYSGGARQQERHGRGLFTFENGDSYNGEWNNGLMHGYGEYTWSDGQKYAGDWENGKHDGRGFMSWSENVSARTKGGRYTGSFKQGKRVGLGSETLVGHCVYAGEWQDDKRAGRGTLKWDNGNTYDGEWVEDQRHGIGLFVWSDGRRFEGLFQNDYPRQGLLSDSRGISYSVKYDPQGVYEIEREPQPIEKSVVAMRDYKGPRYATNLVNSSNLFDHHDQNGLVQDSMSTAKSPLNNSYQSRGASPNVSSSNYIPLSRSLATSMHSSGDATTNYVPLRHIVDTSITPVTVDRAPVRAVGRPVLMRLKLGIDFDSTIGNGDSDARAAFANDLVEDLAHATSLPPTCFHIKTLSPGSVIADVDICPDTSGNNSDPFAAADSLAQQANDQYSKLRTGKVMRSLEAISFPNLKPGPMTPVAKAKTPANASPDVPRVIKTTTLQKPSPVSGQAERISVDVNSNITQAAAHKADCECDHCYVHRLENRARGAPLVSGVVQVRVLILIGIVFVVGYKQ